MNSVLRFETQPDLPDRGRYLPAGAKSKMPQKMKSNLSKMGEPGAGFEIGFQRRRFLRTVAELQRCPPLFSVARLHNALEAVTRTVAFPQFPAHTGGFRRMPEPK
jgi:hypothetical protein